jgi:SAM-dependent methyltransferase
MSTYAKIRSKLFRFYFFCQKRIVPGLRDSQYLYIDKLLATVDEGSRWLDLGCGYRVVPAWTGFDESLLADKAALIIGVDRDAAALRQHNSLHARVVADIDHLPFREGAFNVVSANMVVEHLQSPEKNLSEILHVLEPGGCFVFHTVNIHHYNAWISSLLPERLKLWLVSLLENRRQEDVYPTHYVLNTPACIQAGAASAGLEVEEIKMVNSSAETIMLGPVALLELFVIRILNHRWLKRWRSNVIGTLRRPAVSSLRAKHTKEGERSPGAAQSCT